MKKYSSLLLLSLIAVAMSSCGNKKSEAEKGDGVVVYDTTQVTQLKVAPEYYFSGQFVYAADAAVLREAASGALIPVAMEEHYPTAEKEYTALNLKMGESAYAEFLGYLKDKASDEEGFAQKLVITRFISMSKTAKPGAGNSLLAGKYTLDGRVLQLNPDHSYQQTFPDAETQTGKWYLSTENVLVLSLGGGYIIMDVDYARKELKTRGEKQVVFSGCKPG